MNMQKRHDNMYFWNLLVKVKYRLRKDTNIKREGKKR